jgi:hypothetical protein
MASDEQDFYAGVPVFDSFADVIEPSRYRPVPDDWVIGFADVVGSTKAIEQGRYKAVNMVGAGVIACVSNALERRTFPYVFGGDGASFAVSAAHAKNAANALAAMAVFAREELDIDLRVAMVPVTAVRAAGRDVRVGRFAASEHCTYAMFAGGGLSWVEAEAKRGDHWLPPAPPGSRPDLSDLSCRWTIAPAARGLILSLIVMPRADEASFRALVKEIVDMATNAQDGGRPITLSSLTNAYPTEGITLETTATTKPGQSRLMRRLEVTAIYFIALALRMFKLKAKPLDLTVFSSDVAANADFRKFDDGLRMTLDCSPEFADAIEARLRAASDIVDYGTFRQDHALMTCFVPSMTDRGHVHFVDGAGGGYAMAAQAMKKRLAPA